MEILTSAQRIVSIDRYIQTQSTGTPKEFADKLNISESYLYQLLALLKSMGGPIAYSRKKRTYLYKSQVNFVLGYQTREIQ